MDKIICLGKNYFKSEVEREDPGAGDPPVIFLKPPSVLREVPLHKREQQLWHPFEKNSLLADCEVVLRICREGFRWNLEEASSAVDAFTIGLDMTLIDRLRIFAEKGQPWEVSKVFPDSAVVGPWIAASELSRHAEREFSFRLNGDVKLQGSLKGIRTGLLESVAYASQHFQLCAGDLLFTGTPHGVGPILAGQTGELSWGDLRYQVRWSS